MTEKFVSLADDGEVRFPRKALCRGFHPDDVLRTVRLARYDVVAPQIDIAHGGGDDDYRKKSKTESPCKPHSACRG